MSYTILARKYRPQQFDEVIAQNHVTRTLRNGLKSGRVSSGYLFTGPRGTGKTSTARLLAKALNCAEGPTETPCDKCPACLEIISGSSLDVLEIDAASNTGVDDIRTLRENVRYLPTTGKKRIYIIDEVHRLSGSAFDALLKTLEEPPEHVVFILATTEPHKVPDTIRSRTQRHDFHRVGIRDLTQHLRKIAASEKIEITDEAIYILSRKADGSVRDSISLLDQLWAFADEKISEADVNDALGLIDSHFYFEYVETIAARDSSAGLDMVKNLVDAGIEISEFCIGLARHFRNLLILISAKEPERLLELSSSEMEEYKKQREYFSSGDLLRMIKIISDLNLDLKSGLEPRFLIETTTLKLTNLESTVSFEEILAHLADTPQVSGKAGNVDLFGRPMDNKTGPQTAISTEPVEDPLAKVTDSIAVPDGKTVNLPIIQTSWPKFVEYLKGKNQMLAAHLSMAEIREFKDNTITAVFHNAGGTSKQVVDKNDYMGIILSELREFYKTGLNIKFIVDAAKMPAQIPKPKSKLETVDAGKLMEENGDIKRLVEKFDGEIIGKKKSDD
jgi:DNA polymerase-3 subunit gamma/tau